MHCSAAAGAGSVVGLDDELDPREMIRQRATTGTPLLGASVPQRRINFLRFRFRTRDCLLEILQSQSELVGIKLLRAPAKLHALELADQMAQPIVLSGKLIVLVTQAGVLGTLGPRRQYQGAQRSDIVGEGRGRC